jgi:hypothetical protein
MRGRCIINTGTELGSPVHGHFFGRETRFNLKVGSDYSILGLGLFETVLLALVPDETRKPNWLPVGLFSFDSSELPSDWGFVLLDGAAASGGDSSNRWVARWGYLELVTDASHSDLLIKRDPKAIEIFNRRLSSLED